MSRFVFKIFMFVGILVGFIGCAVIPKTLPSKEKLSLLSPEEFFEEIKMDKEKDQYQIVLSKFITNMGIDDYTHPIRFKSRLYYQTRLVHYDFGSKMSDLYKNHFKKYCEAKGGKILDEDAYIDRFPFADKSTEAQNKYSSILSSYVKNWRKVIHICVVKDTPIFGYIIKQYRDNVKENFWWNVEINAVAFDQNDFNKAKKIIDIMIKNGYKPKIDKVPNQKEEKYRF